MTRKEFQNEVRLFSRKHLFGLDLKIDYNPDREAYVASRSYVSISHYGKQQPWQKSLAPWRIGIPGDDGGTVNGEGDTPEEAFRNLLGLNDK